MNTTGSSKWRRFSDYEIRTLNGGTKYVVPVPGSAAVFYDPMLRPDKLAISVLDAAAEIKKDKTCETVILDLVRLTGLPGFAAASPGDYEFPFGGSPAPENDLRLSQRGPEYGCVFSEDYAEKYEDICAWLERIGDSLSCVDSQTKEPDFTNLESMAEYCIFSLHRDGKLHTCAYCKKIYYSEDPESETCSKACEFQYSLSDMAPESKKRYIGPLVGGG